jgi:hypothetical protein
MRTARSVIRVRSLAHYRARVEAVARTLRARVVEDRRVLIARVNHGRWIADCPQCLGGIALEPEWPEVGCLECAHWFAAIAVPIDRADIEAALKVRPRVNQNWTPGETVTRLRQENDQHRSVLLREVS